MEMTQLIIAIIGGVVTIVASIGGAWVAVKTLLAIHNEKIGRMEKDISEMKDERKAIDTELKSIFRVISKIDKTLAAIDERTKN